MNFYMSLCCRRIENHYTPNMSVTLTETCRSEEHELTARMDEQIQLTAVKHSDGYPKGMRLIAITILLVLSILLSALDSMIIATSILEITNEFGPTLSST